MHRSAQGPRIFSGWLLILGSLAILGAGCSSHIIASHEPMHSLGEPVILKAHAKGLVDRIELRIKRFNVESGTGEETAETDKELVVWVCNPFFIKNGLVCKHPIAFSGDAQVIEFHAKALYWNGKARHERYRFASGNYPLVTPIPIRANLHPDNALDVVIVPEDDMRIDEYDHSWSFLRTVLDDLVDEIYFGYPAFRKNRGIFNFWYVDEAGQIEGPCDFVVPQQLEVDDSLASWIDAVTLVHSRPMRDCAVGNVMSTEFLYDKSVVHESGHSLFDLRDEYPVAVLGAYGPQNDYANTFWTEAKCRQQAPEIGLPRRSCEEITAGGIWRIDPTGPEGCIMGPSQNLDDSDFGPACMRRIKRRIEQCLDGECFPLQDTGDLFEDEQQTE